VPIRARKKPSQVRRAALATYYETGNILASARAIGIGATTLARWIEEEETKREPALARMRAGEPAQKIARDLDISDVAVGRWAAEDGLPRRGRGWKSWSLSVDPKIMRRREQQRTRREQIRDGSHTPKPKPSPAELAARKAKALAMYRDNRPDREILETADIGSSTLWRWVKQAGATRAVITTRWSPNAERMPEALAMWQANTPHDEIERVTGIKIGTVRYQAKKAGLERPDGRYKPTDDPEKLRARAKAKAFRERRKRSSGLNSSKTHHRAPEGRRNPGIA
jgi:transposase